MKNFNCEEKQNDEETLLCVDVQQLLTPSLSHVPAAALDALQHLPKVGNIYTLDSGSSKGARFVSDVVHGAHFAW